MTLITALRAAFALLLALLFAGSTAAGATAEPANSPTFQTRARAVVSVLSAPQLATPDTRRARPSRAVRASAPARSRAYARSFIARKYGWGPAQFKCLRAMWNRESGWRYWVSNPNGRYHGIPQTSAAVWSRAGYTRSQYLNSPQVQVKVGAKYIKVRYHTPCQAWAFWRRHHWY